MSELALFLIRIGFVAVLWVFILSLLSVIRADLYGRRVISRIAKQNAPMLTAGSAASLGIEDGDSFDPTEIAVLTGRTAGTNIPLENKKVHVGPDWVLQDLNSTNGTNLDGKKITTPVTIRAGMTIRIGTTTFELRS